MPRMLAFIIILLIVGLIAGALARLLVPGRDPIGLLGTIVLGVLGSFLGGFILNLIEYHTLAVHHLRTAGIIGSIAGALILLILFRLSGHERGHKRYGRSRSRSQPPSPLDLTAPAAPVNRTSGLTATDWPEHGTDRRPGTFPPGAGPSPCGSEAVPPGMPGPGRR